MEGAWNVKVLFIFIHVCDFDLFSLIFLRMRFWDGDHDSKPRWIEEGRVNPPTLPRARHMVVI